MSRKARAVSGEKLARQRAAQRKRTALFVAAAVLAGAVIVGVAVYTMRDKAPEVFAVPRNATTTGVTVGKADAKVTIDLYVDYLCPACKRFEAQASDALEKLVVDGTAKVTNHPIAILDGASTTRYSTRASAASGCAAEAGAFEKFTASLFANQPPEGGPGLTNETLIELGKAAGATGPAFEKCVAEGTYTGWSTALTETASRKGITSTPTVLVDGAQLTDLTVESLQAAVAEAASK